METENEQLIECYGCGILEHEDYISHDCLCEGCYGKFH